MIDLHCHILPALDDGARDLDDSVEMARQAFAHGISVVAATPHIRERSPNVVIGELEERVDALNTELGQRRVPVRIVTGGEVAEPMLDRLDEDDLRKVSLDGQGWILLEPRPGPLSDHLEEAVGELARRGFRSLIAHPERHRSPDFQERLEALVAAGALIQVTAGKLAAGPAARVMLGLAELGLVHVVATDAHSSRGGRPLRFREGLASLRRIPRIAPYAEWTVHDGPAAILAGEDVMPPFAPVPKRD